VGPFSATYSGGSGPAGTEAYAWAFTGPLPPNGVTFVNPAGASSQQVQFDSVPDPGTYSVSLKVSITDHQGNTSTDTATATASNQASNN
jgi:uncharacterized protein YfaP (DUF2135 family)